MGRVIIHYDVDKDELVNDEDEKKLEEELEKLKKNFNEKPLI